MKLSKSAGPVSAPAPETRARFHSNLNGKGKEPLNGINNVGDNTSNFGRAYNVPHYSMQSSIRPSTADGNYNGRSKFRGSLLVAASDALGFKFGRRRPSIRQRPTQVIFPDVIEIRAPHADEEVEERNRLRDMAAQAIGLGPLMVSQENQARDDSATDEDEEDQPPILDSTESRRLGLARNSESTPNIAGGSNLSVSLPTQQRHQQANGGRFRSGSMLAHSPSNSMTIAPIPSYPSTVSALTPFLQSSGVYTKYYPPSSLRIFALSRNWKNRFFILSSPATLVTRGQGPAVSYLHLFKSSSSDDEEMERLEINEDSVVFLSEEAVGGKRNVIKVGGVDVGAMKKEYIHEEGGHTMWLLQISEPADAQRWITNIKNAILGQRTVRAGLIPAHTLENNEPRGDMDVMLSIRAQGLVTSAPAGPISTTRSRDTMSPAPFSQSDINHNYASSISSHSARSHTTVPKPASPTNAVSALKGLFANSGRPRSASRATSIDSERGQDREANEGSFTSMGGNFLSMLRSNTPDTQSVATIPSTRSNLPLSGPVHPLERHIDRRVLSERQPMQWTASEPTHSMNKDRAANKTFSMGELSLQPPPRKRWTSVGPTTASPCLDHSMRTSIDNSSRRTSLSKSVTSAVEKVETEPSASPQLSNFQFGTPEQRPRAPSLQSVSTCGSNENVISMERSSSSTKRSSGTRSTRRWSRQGILPKRLTPPSIPPPAVPTTQTQGGTDSSAERAASPSTSQSSQKSVVPSLPTFSKRTSGSSVNSNSSFGTSHSQQASAATPPNLNSNPVITRAPPSHRTSIPPPRPAPTSALPPAPIDNDQDVLKPLEPIAASPKSSLRTSVGHRTFRLSMGAPKPPPSTTLPPRPDEPEYKSHRRSYSGGGISQSTKLETIPASPVPAHKLISPFPPPAGPLPAPPLNAGSLPIQVQPTPKRTTSIKQRLRILSAPVLASGNQTQPIASPYPSRPLTNIVTLPKISTTPPPATPIAEKITMFQNDPSFLQMHTPVLPSLPQPQSFLPHSDRPKEIDEVTSLSPPPRRGSKQLLETDLETAESVLAQAEPLSRLSVVEEPTPRYLSLSCPGSIRSDHSEHFEGDWESPKDEDPPEELPSLEPSEKRPASPIEPRYFSLSRPGSVVSLGVVTM